MFGHIVIEASKADELYAEQISRWFLQALPGAVGSAKGQMEAVFEEFMASGKVRLGPRPNPESQVAMRDVIRHYMAQSRPIPVLVPWGSEKPDEGGIDIAEVAGLRTLHDLAWRVQQRYSPGVAIRIRVEDASAPHLFWQRAEASRIASAEYTSQFTSLVRIFGGPVVAVPESTMVWAEDFASHANTLVPLFERYIKDTDLYGMRDYEGRASFAALRDAGWAGEIPQVQRDYYRNTYAKLYGIDPRGEEATHTLARYMAEALTRRHLNMLGNDKSWEGGWIQVSLVPPVPGAPTQTTGRTIYYRTLPENVSATHMPPWRAKGYLEAQEDGAFKPKLTTIRVGLDLHEAHVTLCDAQERVDVRADYTIGGP